MKVSSLEVVYSRDEIQAKIDEIGKNITEFYKNEPVVVICVLKGASIFFSDLIRKINNDNIYIDFISISSYKNRNIGGDIELNIPLSTDIEGKNVLIVEDIVDTGNSMHFLCEELKKKKPKSIKIASLIDKYERRKCDITVDFRCFYLREGFIVGYGLDYAERYRNLPDICRVKFEE